MDYWRRRARRLLAKMAPAPPLPANVSLRCREIMPSDLEGVTDLLTTGFWQVPRDHWVNAFRRLSTHQTPQGFPKYGYMLENDGIPVGVLITIFTARIVDGATSVWCNGSSYYVEPAFRYSASVLISRSHRFKDVTYLDVAPSPRRWPMLDAQGFKRLAKGVYVAIPALCRSASGVQVRVVAGSCLDKRLEPFEADLLVAHASYGCVSMICEHQGTVYPFVFVVRRRYGVRFAYLIYSRNQTDFVRLAGAVGRFFAGRRILVVALDADGPISGLPGKHRDILPKYWRGRERPRLGDLAYTEIAMFGVI
jgi:hypothetical protein